MCLNAEAMKLLLLLWSVFVAGSFAEKEPVVEIKNGLVSGAHRTSYDGKIFSAFEGIPFAKPPVGDLRFKEPQPIPPWTGIWVANTKHLCAQYSTWSKIFAGDEDCLYINVYVPRENLNATEKLDVIVHIHGGAFMVGGPHYLIGPEYLMDRDVVFVTFNYRLGPFGFLSTQDEVLPGNHGLRDQTLALRWIKTNIVKFGGNPKSVTLTGLSAGGASVHFHYVSPLSKGLFHRGFSQSGTILQSWALQMNPTDNVKKLAAITGCYHESSENMVACLRQRPAKEIGNAVSHFFVDDLPIAPFGPVVERLPKNAFLPNHPYYLVKRGIVNDVPWIVSVATHEGLFPAIFYVDNTDYLDKNWDRIAPDLLVFNFTTTTSQKLVLPSKIKERYFLNKPINKDNFQNLVQLLSDRLFTMDSEKAAREQAASANSPVYFLVVGWKGQHNLPNLLMQKDIEGVSHGDDGFFYLYPNLPNSKLNEESEKMKNLYADMLVEYSKTGVPRFGKINWEPVSEEKELSHLFIQSPYDIQQKKVDELGPTEFWQWAALRENENIVLFSKPKENASPEKKEEL